jgi:hypothetical protein
MADARVLRDLAEEVEGLDGPNRETEKRIWRALNPHAYGFSANQAEAYTGSVDAAMTMKPPRWRLANFQEEPPEIGGWRATGHRASPGVAIEGAAAKTASLTVTALWLRALAADLEGTDAATV